MMILSMTMLLIFSLVQGTKSPAEPQGLAVPSPEALGDDNVNYSESRGDLENPRDTHTVPVHVIIPLSLQNFYTRQNQSQR